MSDEDFESFDEMMRAIAREVTRAAERVSHIDLDGIARMMGVDPETTKDWVQEASSWLRAQAENAGEDFSFQHAQTPKRSDAPAEEDPLSGAAPHPLDIPTDEQGLALSALDSGRWTVEAGTERLISHGEGPAPQDALGLVRELRARDWITAEGEVTLVGRHALSRWLETTSS